MPLNQQSNGAPVRVFAHNVAQAAMADSRFTSGYAPNDKPPAHEFNTLVKELAEGLNHVLFRGVAIWLTSKAYPVGAVVQQGGALYMAVTANTASAPTPTNPDWQVLLTASNFIQFWPFSIGPSPRTITSQIVSIPAGFATTSSTGLPMGKTPATLTCTIAAVGIGGLDAGVATVSTWYNLYLVSGTAGIGLLFSLNNTTPTLPSGYTLFKNLRTPFRTASTGVQLLPLRYEGIGTDTHTGIYQQPDYDGLGLTAGLGELNVLAGGTATVFTNVLVDLAPPSAHMAQLTHSARTGYSFIRSVGSGFAASVASPNLVDFVDTIWVELVGGRNIQYRVTANSTSIVCKGFKLSAI